MKLRSDGKFMKWGLTAFLVFVACAVFWIIFSNLPGFYDVIRSFFSIIAPLTYGCLFAYLMNPIMKRSQSFLHRKLSASKRKFKERTVERVSLTVSVVISLLALLSILYAFCAIVIPSLISSIEDLIPKIQGYYNTVMTWVEEVVTKIGLEEWLQENMNELTSTLTELVKKLDVASYVGSLTSSVYNIIAGLFNFLIGIIAAVYILVYKQQLCAQAKKITVALFNTSHANRIFEVSRRTNRIFSGYVIGKLLDAAIVGVITYIALLIMGLPYAPLIAVIVGVTNIIPFFGPFIGAVPSTVLLLLDEPINAVYFVLFIIVLQMIDGYIIENRILGEKLGISDFWVLTSILIFGGVFGFAGMLLGVPVFAVIYSLISDGVDRRLARKRYPTATNTYYSLRCVEDLPVEPAPSYSYVSVEPAYDMNTEPEEEMEEEDEEA